MDYTLSCINGYSGGIVGSGKGDITYSNYSGSIVIEVSDPPVDPENPEVVPVNMIYAGGIAGYLEGNIMACDSAASITLNGEYSIAYAGSIAGFLKGRSEGSDVSAAELEVLYAEGDVYIGGAVGYMSGNMEGCALTGAVVWLESFLPERLSVGITVER